MKQIKLTKNLITLVDDDDFLLYSKFKWYASGGRPSNNQKYYAVREEYFNGQRRIIQLHRLIVNCPDNLYVDHINGNSLDNRKENLRICTHKENIRNQKIKITNTSGLKGVSKKGKKWRARLMLNYKEINLGVFGTKEDAAKAYNDAAIKYFGNFANINKE